MVKFGGANRVNRGGGWRFSPAAVRCAERGQTAPADRSDCLGFRLVRTD